MATWQVWNMVKDPVSREDGDENVFPEAVFSFHAKNSMSALNKIRKWLRCAAENTDSGYGYYSYNIDSAFSIKLLDKEDIQTEDLNNEAFED